MIAKRGARVIGVEISEEAVASACAKFPSVEFQCFDAVTRTEQLEAVATGCDKLFLDVGGDRDLPALLHLLVFLQVRHCSRAPNVCLQLCAMLGLAGLASAAQHRPRRTILIHVYFGEGKSGQTAVGTG